MGTVREIWQFLDEKKTAIGAGLMVAGKIMQRFPQTAVAGSICEEVGLYIAAGGLMHKGVKAAQGPK